MGRARLLLAGAALPLACVIGAMPALAGGPGRHRTDAQNHRAALRNASSLIREARLPASARPYSGEPSRDHENLGRAPTRLLGDVVRKTAWWRTGESPSAVLEFVKSHPPAHGHLGMTGQAGHCQPHHFPPRHCQVEMAFVGFQLPPVPQELGARWLLVAVARQTDGTTTIRIDAQVQWLIFRPASERVPAGVTAIRVTRPGYRRSKPVSRRVTRSVRVHRIIRLIDRLPIVQPGITSCPGGAAPPVTFTFLGGGRVLAGATVRADVGPSDNSCDAMFFSLNGHPQTPLVHARRFLLAVGHLLGVQLATRAPGY